MSPSPTPPPLARACGTTIGLPTAFPGVRRDGGSGQAAGESAAPHRRRVATGKDGNPLNEVELLSDSLINNDGLLRGNNVIKLVPEESVSKLGFGEQITLSASQFERLARAFLSEIQASSSSPYGAGHSCTGWFECMCSR